MGIRTQSQSSDLELGEGKTFQSPCKIASGTLIAKDKYLRDMGPRGGSKIAFFVDVRRALGRVYGTSRRGSSITRK